MTVYGSETHAATTTLPPLSERVFAAGVTAVPQGPDGIGWRAAHLGDVPAITALFERMSARDHPDWSESEDEVREEFQRSWVDLAHDTAVAIDAAGTLVAFGLVIVPPEPESIVRVFLTGGVDPAFRGRGIGRRLLDWQHVRARQRLSASSLRLPGWVLSYAADASPEHGALLTRAGFEPARYFTTLECELATAVLPDHSVPNVVIEPFRADLSEAVRIAKNAAFADHWGSQPTQREQWESMQSLPSWRPALSRVARAGVDVVGFVITEINEDDWRRQGVSSGYIGLVGTVPGWRGRGLASAMLSAVLTAYRDEGIERAVLDVDTENSTGALGVYTRLGFSATARDVAYLQAY